VGNLHLVVGSVRYKRRYVKHPRNVTSTTARVRPFAVAKIQPDSDAVGAADAGVVRRATNKMEQFVAVP